MSTQRIIRANEEFIKQYFDYGLLIPARTIYMDSEVDDISASYVIKGLNILESISQTEPIRILMNNYGGSEQDGLAIYDNIKRIAAHTDVYIDVYGNCMSMAAWILQAGTFRRMSKHSLMMIHVGYNSLGANHPEINKRWIKAWEKQEPMFENMLLDRIHEKNPTYRRSALKKMLMFDTILTPEEAEEIGLIDAIIE